MAIEEGIQQPGIGQRPAQKLTHQELDHILHPHRVRDRVLLAAAAGTLAVAGVFVLKAAGNTSNNPEANPLPRDQHGFVILPSASPDTNWIKFMPPQETEVPINKVPLAKITAESGNLAIRNSSGLTPDKNNPIGVTVDLENATIGDIQIDHTTGSAVLTMLLPGDSLTEKFTDIYTLNFDGSKTQSVGYQGLTVKVTINSDTWSFSVNNHSAANVVRGLESIAPSLKVGGAIPTISIFPNNPHEISNAIDQLKALKPGAPNNRLAPSVSFISNEIVLSIK